MDKTSLQRRKRSSLECKNRTYVRPNNKQRLQLGSLNDVSTNPVVNGHGNDTSLITNGKPLRRCRSLASEDIFTSLDITGHPERRRSQLIPRARLVDKTVFKDRRRPPRNNETDTTERKESNYQSITYKQYPPPRNRSDTDDSLDSNYQNKSSFQSVYQVSHDNLTYADVGLNLPKYYPDPRYDTDVSVKTDNYSIYSESDYFDENTRSLPNFAYEFDPNISENYYESNTFNPIYSEYEYMSISADDSGSELNNFDEITVVNNKNRDDKEGEINNNQLDETSTEEDTEQLGTHNSEENDPDPEDNPNLGRNQSSVDSQNSDENFKLLKSSKHLENHSSIERTSSECISRSRRHSGEVNFKLLVKGSSKHSNEHATVSESPAQKEPKNKSPVENLERIEVLAENPSTDRDYITTITIDDSPKLPDKPKKSGKKSPTVKRQNSFRKPLNFITKNISKAFGEKDRKKPKPIAVETDNQFYSSLPDINASKYLEKCERIDRKLRKCDKYPTKDTRNRFVVNIGQHLNLEKNENTPIPVDFEIKISKVPKKNSDKQTDRNNNEKVQSKHKLTRKTSNSADVEKSRVKTLPKITEVIEKTERKIVEVKPQIKTIRNFTKIDEKPLNTYKQEIPKIQKQHRVKNQNANIKPDRQLFEKTENFSKAGSTKFLTNDPNILVKTENFTKTEELKVSVADLKVKEDTRSNSSPIDIPKRVAEEYKNPDMEFDNKIEGKASPDLNQEYQEKVDTMRCFWNKMMDKDQEKGSKEEEQEKPLSPKLVISHFENLSSGKTSPKPEPCKVVEVQSKIENVRKIFEQFPEKPRELGTSLVETNKKIFEPTKVEKTFVKESCGLFEGNFFPLGSDGMYESLNPNVVEIIERTEVDGMKNGESRAQQKRKIWQKNGKWQADRTENSDGSWQMNGKDEQNWQDCDLENGTQFWQPNGASNAQQFWQQNDIRNYSVKRHNTLKKAKEFENGPEFDHVRYKVMKSDLFQKNIFANYEKESQFDGLMQYLQDYSFQELLIDNNIVIIEPIRTKVEYQDSQKKSRKLTQIIPKIPKNPDSKESSLRKHFFYHPIRVNREVNDEELPNPDTVKQVRQIFERSGTMERSQSSKELDNKPKKKTICYQQVVDPDRDRCSDISDHSEKNESLQTNEDNLDSLENDKQYISEDILKKIRDCGTCVTYYGGKILRKNNDEQLSPMTKAIMEEIRGWQRRNEECGCKKRGSRRNSNEKPDEGYQGIKFKLLKSNSCSSRLELVGTENLSEYRKKFLERQKQIIEEQNLKNQQNDLEKAIKDSVNEDSKNGMDSPKIVAEEIKRIPWCIEEEREESERVKGENTKLVDFKHYEVRKKSNKYDDMEFEHFQVLEK